MIIRDLKKSDSDSLLNFYKTLSRMPGGIARLESEITASYLDYIYALVENEGIGKVAFEGNLLVGEIHLGKKGIDIYRHILGGLTVGVHPNFQNKGIATQLFECIFTEVQLNRPHIYRVELECRAANQMAVHLYKKLGFIEEGRMVKQTKNLDGSHEDGLMMAWFNPNYTL